MQQAVRIRLALAVCRTAAVRLESSLVQLAAAASVVVVVRIAAVEAVEAVAAHTAVVVAAVVQSARQVQQLVQQLALRTSAVAVVQQVQYLAHWQLRIYLAEYLRRPRSTTF